MYGDLPSLEYDINCVMLHFKRNLKIAKDTIPRGFRKNYVPKWDARCNELGSQHKKVQSVEEKLLSAKRLIDHLNTKRKEQWISTVESIDMKRSSWRAWSTIKKLTGRKTVSPNPNLISPNAVTSCLLNNGKFKSPNCQFTREVNRQLKEEWNAPSADQNLCEKFTDDEIIAAIKSLKAGIALGADNLHPEFFLHIHENCIQWLRSFFNVCLHTEKVPKIWKLAKVVAVLKQKKPPNVASSYRPVTLLCVRSKFDERLIYNRIQPIAESLFPKEQAGFRPGRFSQDQVVSRTEDIECTFDKKLKAGVVFADLSAAYDTVWHCGLTLKLLRSLQSKEMVRVIMPMILQRRFMYTSVVRNHAAEPCLTVYHRVPSLHLSFSTCIRTISHQLPVKNTSMLTI